jgi:hypothetical protein
MPATATPTTSEAVLPMRELYRQEMGCQVVYDSLHRRPGLTTTYALQFDDTSVGFGSMAIGGPWAGKPTLVPYAHLLNGSIPAP